MFRLHQFWGFTSLFILILELKIILNYIMGRRQNKYKFPHEDFISNMPDNVVTDILNRMPLQKAVRTSILSRNWRYKWTMLSQLVFDEPFFYYLADTKNENDYARIISRLLLNIIGIITKFVLYIEEEYNDEDIAHWILFLSRKGVKDLTIFKRNGELLELPTRLFSCLELKHLNLDNCCFSPPTSFHGFPKLLSLELHNVEFKRGKFGKYITQCPVLEILNMGCNDEAGVKLVEIAKLINLKILTLTMSNFANNMITSSNSVFKLVGCLPKLQELHLDFQGCKFTECGAKKSFPTTFPCFKTLKLSKIDLGNDIMLLCAFELIRYTPNLQTLEITAFRYDVGPPPKIPEEEYNTMGPLQLRSVVFSDLEGSQNELCLIKYLLACSPFLKKMVIRFNYPAPSSDVKFMFARNLLKLHRASPLVYIDLD